ncbi:MAG TPA: DUF1499 domain-containing protein [Candidatus Binatia bacterium]|nr:DUF1499 domain-containing protein [Candidatus Binatia bacterium]
MGRILPLQILNLLAIWFITMPLFSCSGTRPANLGVKDGRLSVCPASPNCVSSDAVDDAHAVVPFQLIVPPTDAWRGLRTAVDALPRTKIVNATDDYLHVECSSAVFGFVDDLELHLRPAEKLIAVRSASRLGHSDFGVNRKRVEQLRALLITQGIVR